MCCSQFIKVLVDEDRMILCRKEDLKRTEVNKLIKKAFPELFTGLIKRFFKKVDYHVSCCYETYSSHFDCQVDSLERNHKWDKNPFMALRVFERGGTNFCSAEPVVLK